jgi:hypothetical protein
MRDANPSCRSLLISWLCIATGVLLMDRYGNPGWFAALLPMGIALWIRVEYDKATFAGLRGRGNWQVFAFVYYALLLLFVVVATLRHIRLDGAPFFVELLVLLFPALAWMVAADYQVCAGRSRQRAGNGV